MHDAPVKAGHSRLSRRDFLKLAGTGAAGFLVSRCGKSPAGSRGEVSENMWWSTDSYVYHWWADGLRAQDKVFNIQSSTCGLSFDFQHCALRKLGRIANPPSEAEALLQDNSLIESLPDVSLTAEMRVGDRHVSVTGAGRSYEDCQLIESGRYFQRRWMTHLAFEGGTPSIDPRESGLELNAWHDRVTFVLRITPRENLTDAALLLQVNLPEIFSTLHTGEGAGCFTREDGEGFVFLPVKAGDALTFDAPSRSVIVRADIDTWRAGEEHAVGLIIYPSIQASDVLAQLTLREAHPLTVRAAQRQPESHNLDVDYEREQGWTVIHLRNDGDVAGYAASSNHRIERVDITIENPDPHPHVVRLAFSKMGEVFGITGISAVLRDRDGHPLGRPVQLSKNWHKGGTTDQSVRFEGPWYRALVVMTVPPETTLSFEYTSVNAFWGILPAASHAQLCLVGWGSNQLWEQAAIGSWGENLCFEPDQGQVGGAVLDTRPLMVWGMGEEPRKKWGWTHNVGGADFLVYYDTSGKKQHNSRMKTRTRRTGPNLTEVTYAGTSADRKIDLCYTVSLYRTDDITRGVYHVRYDVRERVEFAKLVLFQCGSYDYSYTGERAFAYGNEQGLMKEWETQWGSFQYRTARMELKGRVPWVSMHEAVRRVADEGAWANRGLVVRSWQAQLGGQEASPWIAEIGAPVRSVDTSLVDVLPPPGVTALLPGDFVEAEIVHVVMPQYAADYYGPNENLHQALEQDENTWRMIYREAVGNDLEVQVTRGGTLLRSYPIRIRSEGRVVGFSVTGGVGYVPVTISGLPDVRGYRLEMKTNGAWVALDQSYHGNDFWQADYEPESRTWELTYSLPLDTPGDERVTRNFRLMST